MSRQTYVRQDQPPLLAKSNASRSDNVSDCQPRIPSCSINPQNILAAPSPTQGNVGVSDEIAWKHEGNLLVLLPTLIQWWKFRTLIALARDLGPLRLVCLRSSSLRVF